MIRKIFTACFLLVTSQLVCAADDEENQISVKVGDDIQQIVSNTANAGKTLVFEPGTYELNLELKNNVSLRGRSTKDVVFKSKSLTLSEPTITLNGATGMKIQNITFIDNIYGIKLLEIGSDVNVEISNNVFNMGFTIADNKRIAIWMGNVPGVTIANNVFYKNDIAILSEDTLTLIKQNIFDQNVSDIDNLLSENVDANCYSKALPTFLISNIDGNISNAEPDFVDPENRDFHLPADSDNDCIVTTTGTQELMIHGAYGGDGADNIPAAIEIATLVDDELASAGKVTLSWKENKAREVTGYKVYYSNSPLQSFNTLDERKDLDSVIAGNSLTVDVVDLTAETVKPAAPVLTSVDPKDRKLILNWQAVTGADSYQIYYTGRESDPITATGVTSYELTGLNNDQVYSVWLTARAQQQYYFQVVAYTDQNSSSTFSESFFRFSDGHITPGEVEVSEISNKISQQPEAIVAYPVLPNEGCFIATAAYGYYSADEVMVLRHFRDNYLITNGFGRSFVNWYYEKGPYAADVIRQSEFAKGIARVALLPVIKMLQWLESSFVLFAVVMVFYLVTVVVLTRKFSLLVLRKL